MSGAAKLALLAIIVPVSWGLAIGGAMVLRSGIIHLAAVIGAA